MKRHRLQNKQIDRKYKEFIYSRSGWM